MKKITNAIALTLVLAPLVTAQVISAQPDQLSQLVVQLLKTPTDNALREKIIKLAATAKPTLPEEVERRMARGVAAFEGAKSVADYQDAIKEFQAAVDVAPWYGNAYFKLGFTQDKAEKYADALQNLKWAQMASPDAKDIKTLIYEVEFRNEKYNSPEAKAAREKAKAEADKQAAAELVQMERNRPKVEGKWQLAYFEFRIVRQGDSYSITDLSMFRRPGGWRAKDVYIDAQHLRLTVVQNDCSSCDAKYDLTLSTSGNELTGKLWTQSKGWETAAPGTRVQ